LAQIPSHTPGAADFDIPRIMVAIPIPTSNHVRIRDLSAADMEKKAAA
jgi:hypothetical protein